MSREQHESGQSAANVDVKQEIGTLAGGRAVGVEAATIHGNVSVVLQTYGTTARAARALVALPALQGFVGRDRELATLTKAIRSHRTVLVHGMGGIGKTTLAARAIDELHGAGRFTDGVIWVSEVARAPVDAVCDAVARHLGDDAVPKLPSDAKPDAVREMLASKGDVLLVLDHLDAPETAGMVLNRCLPSTAALVVTSRRRHIGFETDCDTPKLKRKDAIDLFNARAGLASTNAVVDAICRLLGDHPLAIAVAAGRVRAESLPLERLKQRLANEKSRLKALRSGDTDDRYQNVRASLELSVSGLSDVQRQVYTRLAACEGDETGIALLAMICDMNEDDCEDHVGQLVARSVLQRQDNLVGLQGLVRDFGRELLGAQLQDVQREMVAAVRRFAEAHGAVSREHHSALESEVANVLGAIRVASAAGDWNELHALLKVVGSPTDGALSVRGYWRELLDALRSGIDAAAAAGEAAALTRLKNNAAIMSYKLGDYDAARTLYDESLAIARVLESPKRIAHTLHNMGVMAQGLGEYDRARDLYTESLAIKRDLKDNAGIARTQHELARIAQKRGEYEEALDLYRQSMTFKATLGEPLGVASSEFNVAGISQVRGRYDEARAMYDRTLAVYADFDEQEGVASVLRQLGRIAVEQGDYENAEQQLTRSNEIATELSHRAGIGDGLLELGRLHLARREYERARERVLEAASIRMALHDVAGTAATEHELGRVAHAMGQHDEARRLLQQALATRERLGDRTGVAYSRFELGALALSAGNADEARAHFEESLRASRALGVDPCTARALNGLGSVAALLGDTKQAAAHWTECAALLATLRSPLAAEVQAALQAISSSPPSA